MIEILECDCLEHNKYIKRKVWLMEYSLENLSELWNKSKEHRILFSDDINGNFHRFCNVFFSHDMNGNINANGLSWIVDDFVGMLFMSNIKEREALLHFSFFDGRLRFDISANMIKYIFDTYQFDRLNAEIVPFASKRVINFIESLGFKKEGEKRKALVYKNERWNLLLYGLLKEEFEEKWDTMKRQSEVGQQQD